MKQTTNIWKTSALLLAALSLTFVSCSSDDDSDDTADKAAIANRIVQNMVKVDGGTFTMGYDSVVIDGEVCVARKLEKAHQVTLTSSYYICKYTVTQKEYKAIMGTNPSYHEGDDLPVTNITWADTQKFIAALNELTTHTFRLPTEAEWEFAARGGNSSHGYIFAGSNNLNEVAWYEANSDSLTHVVGQKKPNELGLYDMSGNVWEWCNDWAHYYPEEAQTDPITGIIPGTYRVLRGGSESSKAWWCSVFFRHWEDPAIRYNNLGFRVAYSE